MFVPTQRAQSEEILLGNIKFRAWDLGGHEQVRVLWRDYFFEANGIVFMIDISDDNRHEEAKEELYALLNDKHLESLPFLILCNKIDLVNLPPNQIRDNLIASFELESFQSRQIQIFPCSLLKDTNTIASAFQWLGDVL